MLDSIKSWLVEKLGGIYITRDQTYAEINFQVESHSRENLQDIFSGEPLEGEEIMLHIRHSRVDMTAKAKAEIKEANVQSLYWTMNTPDNAHHRIKVTKREKLLIKWFRRAEPREEITIKKDKDGRPDRGYVESSQGISLDDMSSVRNALDEKE